MRLVVAGIAVGAPAGAAALYYALFRIMAPGYEQEA